MDEEAIPVPCPHQRGDMHSAEEFSEELGGAQLRAASNNGWLLYAKNNDKTSDQKQEFSLWNPATSALINLPPLPGERLHASFISSFSTSPRICDSILTLFEYWTNPKSILRWRFGDDVWTRHELKDGDYSFQEESPFEEKEFMGNIFTFDDGRIFCLSNRFSEFRTLKLYVMDLNSPDSVSLVLISNSMPKCQIKTSCSSYGYMLQSCGELYLVYMITRYLKFHEVVGFEVYKFDFATKEWSRENNLGGRVFFVTDLCFFSWHATPKYKANHIYYFEEYPVNSLYAFNMDDQTISVSRYQPWHIPTQTKEKKIVKREVQVNLLEEAIGDFGKLDIDAVSEIGRCLLLHDYMSFRSINSVFRSAAPPIQWISETLQGRHRQPWLMYWGIGESICNFIQPIRPDKKYLMNIPNNQLRDVSAAYSREGWCLMFHDGDSIFLWNPFAKKTIHLPKLARKWTSIKCCSFSPSLDWVVLIYDYCHIASFILKEGEWQLQKIPLIFLDLPIKAKFDNNLTFCNGDFYCFILDPTNSVTVRKLVSFTYNVEDVDVDVDEDEEGFSYIIYDELEMPCSNFEHHRAFLLELNKKLLSVYVGLLGDWVRVFELNDSDMVWVEVEDLGNYTIYVSSDSSFSIAAPPGMDNRIYFSRYHTKKKDFIYYSLESRMLHIHNTKQVVENFYDTEEQSNSLWLEPKWD